MKKIVFTLQVFAMIAIFPAYLVSELNHETSKPQVKDTRPLVKNYHLSVSDI